MLFVIDRTDSVIPAGETLSLEHVSGVQRCSWFIMIASIRYLCSHKNTHTDTHWQILISILIRDTFPLFFLLMKYSITSDTIDVITLKMVLVTVCTRAHMLCIHVYTSREDENNILINRREVDFHNDVSYVVLSPPSRLSSLVLALLRRHLLHVMMFATTVYKRHDSALSILYKLGIVPMGTFLSRWNANNRADTQSA